MNATIYVHLLGEGVDVWRPVSAKHVHGDIHQITGRPPDDVEHWEFKSGDFVRCRQQSFADAKTGLVAYENIPA